MIAKRTSEDPGENEVRSIAGVLGVFDVSKSKTIKPRQTRNMSIDSRDRDEDGPSNEPDGKEHEGHHTKKANEEVGI